MGENSLSVRKKLPIQSMVYCEKEFHSHQDYKIFHLECVRLWRNKEEESDCLLQQT